MREINRFTAAQMRLDRRRWHHVKPKQESLLDRTAQQRRERGKLYDFTILRPSGITINERRQSR